VNEQPSNDTETLLYYNPFFSFLTLAKTPCYWHLRVGNRHQTGFCPPLSSTFANNMSTQRPTPEEAQPQVLSQEQMAELSRLQPPAQTGELQPLSQDSRRRLAFSSLASGPQSAQSYGVRRDLLPDRPPSCACSDTSTPGDAHRGQRAPWDPSPPPTSARRGAVSAQGSGSQVPPPSDKRNAMSEQPIGADENSKKRG